MASRISKKTCLIWVTLISAVLALVVTTLSCGSPSLPSKAPDFTLPTLSGANITLSELEGTPVVLNFWSIDCPACRYQLPFLESVAQRTTGEINVIAVDVGQNASTVQDFLQSFFGKNETSMIVTLDSNGETFVNYCRQYKNSGLIPFTLFVDSEGMVKYVQIGAFASEAVLWDVLHNVFGITVP